MPSKPNWNHPEPYNDEVKLQIVYVADKNLTHLLGHNFIITEAYILFDFCFYGIGVAIVMVDLVNNTNPDYNMVTMGKYHSCVSGFMDGTATTALLGQAPPTAAHDPAAPGQSTLFPVPVTSDSPPFMMKYQGREVCVKEKI